MSQSVRWIVDPKLCSFMGKKAFTLLQRMARHASCHERLFVAPGSPVAALPFMSRGQMAGSLFNDLPGLSDGERKLWATKRLSYLEKGGPGKGWIKLFRVHGSKRTQGAIRFFIPLRLLRGVSKKRGPYSFNNKNISGVSGVRGLGVKGLELLEAPRRFAEMIVGEGIGGAFRAMKREGALAT